MGQVGVWATQPGCNLGVIPQVSVNEVAEDIKAGHLASRGRSNLMNLRGVSRPGVWLGNL